MKNSTGSQIKPITLEGKHVRLVPLSPSHEQGLVDAVKDGELWKLWFTSVPRPEGMGAEITRRLGLQAAGSMLPFTVIEPGSGDVVGMTTYMNIDAAGPRVEIGSTWYARRVQRTPLNTEAKLLLLGHAFDTLDCLGVEFRTHSLNHASRRATDRLGPKLRRILPAHMGLPSGSCRDACAYSIAAAGWPAVKAHLEWKHAQARQGGI